MTEEPQHFSQTSSKSSESHASSHAGTPSPEIEPPANEALLLRAPAIRTVMMPRDTNELGSIFGGHILSLIDLAALQHARSISPKKYVTKVFREVNFIGPVNVGDLVSFYARTLKVGRTSIGIAIDVESLRGPDYLVPIKVTSAEVVMVAVDSTGSPTPI